MARLETGKQEYVLTTGDSFVAKECYYCGAVATSTDHVPPVSTRKMYVDVRCPYPFYEVPACHECNCGLSDELCTLKERKAHVARWLAKRYRKLLNMPDWTDVELAELGPVLRMSIQSNLQRRQIVLDRVRHAQRDTGCVPFKVKRPVKQRVTQKTEQKTLDDFPMRAYATPRGCASGEFCLKLRKFKGNHLYCSQACKLYFYKHGLFK